VLGLKACATTPDLFYFSNRRDDYNKYFNYQNYVFQGKVVNYFIPTHCPREKVKNREIQDTEYEPKEKVHCPRKCGLFT
jgi:hypothetical protein